MDRGKKTARSYPFDLNGHAEENTEDPLLDLVLCLFTFCVSEIQSNSYLENLGEKSLSET